MFGAVGALFSALAFAAVIVALVLQGHDLEVQRLELAATRDDIESARRLSDLRFAMELGQRLEQLRSDTDKAWRTLREHSTKDQQASLEVVDALEIQFRSAQFLYQLSVLTDAGTVDLKTLYLLYYDNILEHAHVRIRDLANWADTAEGFAANYTDEDVLRLASAHRDLLERMRPLHAAYDCSILDYEIDEIAQLEDRLRGGLESVDAPA